MARMIDADALIKSIESDRNCSDMPSQWIDGVNYAIDLIELYEPTIDAVSVVRCDNCKYRYMDADLQVWTCTYGLMIKPNGFCNYGERKESE